MEGFNLGLEKHAQITAEQVAACVNIDELNELLHGQGIIPESSQKQTGDAMIKRIEQVRHGHKDLSFITRAFGLRAKVEELLEDDKVYKKYTQGSKAPKKK